mmetsp:Transcript_128179/g.255979  ORF Transcript_128179/g.255979 Transcript_128179/m.255979 type:complete len:205 (-) Transcript_128179:739-1353(-)
MRISIGVQQGNDRNTSDLGFIDSFLFFHPVHCNQDVRTSIHIHNTTVLCFEKPEVDLSLALIIRFHSFPFTLTLFLHHRFQFLKTLLDHYLVRQNTTHPHFVTIETFGTQGCLFDTFPSLRFGACPQEFATPCCYLHGPIASTVHHSTRLHKIKNVSPIVLGIKILQHLLVPLSWSMAILHASIDHILEVHKFLKVVGHLPAWD